MVRFGRSTVPMTYEIAVLQPTSRVVLVGRGSSIEAVDDIRFSPADGGTRIDYTADLTFRGVMRLVAPFLGRAMDKVGERALDGLAAALD
jgi:carbon monoxide dehydrogenase subunit G